MALSNAITSLVNLSGNAAVDFDVIPNAKHYLKAEFDKTEQQLGILFKDGNATKGMELLESVRPLMSKTDAAHWDLIAESRVAVLDYSAVRDEANAPTFTKQGADASKELDECYTKLEKAVTAAPASTSSSPSALQTCREELAQKMGDLWKGLDTWARERWKGLEQFVMNEGCGEEVKKRHLVYRDDLQQCIEGGWVDFTAFPGKRDKVQEVLKEANFVADHFELLTDAATFDFDR